MLDCTAGAKNIKDLKVSVKLRLNKDGEVLNTKIMNKENE